MKADISCPQFADKLHRLIEESVNYLFCGCDKICDENLGRKGNICLMVWGGTVKDTEAQGSWACCVHQEEERNDAWCSAHFPLFIQCGILAHGMATNIKSMCSLTDMPRSLVQSWLSISWLAILQSQLSESTLEKNHIVVNCSHNLRALPSPSV